MAGRQMQGRKVRWALAAVLLATAPLAAARTLELRIGSDALEGENGFPFSTLPAAYGYSSSRYQQVYSAALFPRPFSISELAFFVVGNGDAAVLPATLEFSLSTTSLGVNQIDGQPFDDNLGPEARHFASFSGGMTLPGGELAIRGEPFWYDPGRGNLLLDIRVYGAPFGHTGPFFSAFGPSDRNGDSPAMVSRWHDFGIGFDDTGLATAFRGIVPEPGTLWLLALGLTGALVGARVRGR